MYFDITTYICSIVDDPVIFRTRPGPTLVYKLIDYFNMYKEIELFISYSSSFIMIIRKPRGVVGNPNFVWESLLTSV